MRRIAVAVSVLGLASATVASAQTEAGGPPAELKKLDVWIGGEWQGTERGRSDPTAAEHEIEWTGGWRWLGDFFVVWNGQWRSTDGLTGSNTSIIGYDPAKGTYFAQGFDSMGARSTASVTFGEKTMTHDITRLDARGNEYRGRCTFQLTAPTLSYECQVLTDGTWWVSARGEGTRAE